jgi:hypothetical protein
MFHRDDKDAELEEEIRSHVEMAARDRMQNGQSAPDARDGAVREFGNVGLVKEVTRAMWSGASLETLLQDIRYGVRMLVKSPDSHWSRFLLLPWASAPTPRCFRW